MAIQRNAKHTNTIYIDADDPRGPWEIVLPVAENGDWVRVYQKRQHPTNSITFTAQPGDTIAPTIVDLPPAPSITAHLDRELVSLGYLESQNEWRVDQWMKDNPFTPVTQITPAQSPYTISDEEYVEADATTGDITIVVPTAIQRSDGATFRVKRIDPGENIVTIDADGDEIGSLYPGVSRGPVARLLGRGVTGEWQYSQAQAAWGVVAASKVQTYREFWQATPTALDGSLLQWTFVPSLPGITSPLLVSHAAGVLTFVEEGDFALQLNVEVDQVLVGNNSDVDWSLTPAYSPVSANMRFARVIKSFAHSRAGTFPASDLQIGSVAANIGDSVQITGASAGAGSSTANLTTGLLMISGG